MTLDVVLVEEPTDADRLALVRPLVAFNETIVGPSGYRQIALLLRDDAGETVGGLWAKASFGWLYVELLVVPAGARGGGLGSRLMARAEQEGRRLGCRGVWVDCFAPLRGFYETAGYAAFGEIPDHPEGTARVFLRKTL